jgi:hypothetical protein
LFYLDRIYRILWIIILFLPSLMEGRKFNPAIAGNPKSPLMNLYETGILGLGPSLEEG